MRRISARLRIFLFIVAIYLFFKVINNVHKNKLLIQYSLIWLFIGFVFIISAIFPGIIIGLSNFVGIETPANFVSFMGIIILLFLNLNYANIISKMRKMMVSNIQDHAIEKYIQEEIDETEDQ